MEIEPRLRGILQDLRARLEGLYGEQLVGLLLYGSQARGEAEEGSDIDVLVVLRGPIDAVAEIGRTGDIVAELSLANEVVISCMFVSQEQFELERSPYLLNARAEGVAVYARGAPAAISLSPRARLQPQEGGPNPKKTAEVGNESVPEFLVSAECAGGGGGGVRPRRTGGDFAEPSRPTSAARGGGPNPKKTAEVGNE